MELAGSEAQGEPKDSPASPCGCGLGSPEANTKVELAAHDVYRR